MHTFAAFQPDAVEVDDQGGNISGPGVITIIPHPARAAVKCVEDCCFHHQTAIDLKQSTFPPPELSGKTGSEQGKVV